MPSLLVQQQQQQFQQQYQLKLGIIHHSSLKTTQLIQFLQNQVNEFLQHDLIQYLKTKQKFINVMESFTIDKNQIINQYSFQQYVGLLLIYSSSSDISFQHFLSCINQILSLNLSDLFLIVIEIDNSDKQTNIIGNQGQNYCKKWNIEWNKLTLYNSQELVTLVNKHIYELVENYYYPNQEDQHNNNMNRKDNNKNINNNNMILTQQYLNNQQQHLEQQQQKQQQQGIPSSSSCYQAPYILTYPNKQSSHVIAYPFQPLASGSSNKQHLLSHAQQLRRSRQKQILIQQQQIDESIYNVQNVLNNINKRINQKIKSKWFNQLNNKIYQKIEKQNQTYCKIKLTQEFIDDHEIYQITRGNHKKKNNNHYHHNINHYNHNSINHNDINNNNHISQFTQSRYTNSILSSLNNNPSILHTPRQSINFNLLKSFKSSSLLKLVLFLSKDTLIQLQIYQYSTYQDIAINAIKKLNIKETENNVKIMIEKIKKRIQMFYKQLNKAIKNNQEKKIQQRSFLKTKIQSNSQQTIN